MASITARTIDQENLATPARLKDRVNFAPVPQKLAPKTPGTRRALGDITNSKSIATPKTASKVNIVTAPANFDDIEFATRFADSDPIEPFTMIDLELDKVACLTTTLEHVAPPSKFDLNSDENPLSNDVLSELLDDLDFDM